MEQTDDMKLKFNTYLLNDDLSIKTHRVNGHKNIVIQDKNQLYSYEETISVINKAIDAERGPYGWSVRFKDADSQLKEVFIRGNNIDNCNETTSSNQSLHEWVDRLFDKDSRQTNLF